MISRWTRRRRVAAGWRITDKIWVASFRCPKIARKPCSLFPTKAKAEDYRDIKLLKALGPFHISKPLSLLREDAELKGKIITIHKRAPSISRMLRGGLEVLGDWCESAVTKTDLDQSDDQCPRCGRSRRVHKWLVRGHTSASCQENSCRARHYRHWPIIYDLIVMIFESCNPAPKLQSGPKSCLRT